MKYKKQNQNAKGQILLITLLVLTILSIITITIILINSRDIKEVSSNRKYDQIYAAVEDKTKELIRTFGRYETPLTTLSNAPYNCFPESSNKYNCTYTLASGVYNANIVVSNEKSYVDYQVFKDRGLEINLVGYKDYLDLHWEKSGLPANEQASMEFILVYTDAAGNYRVKTDVYNPAGVYTSAPAAGSPFTYFENPGYPGNTFARRIGFSTSLTATENPQKLVIIPRMTATNGSVELDVSPTTPGIYPDQVRVFKGNSYDNSDDETPVVNIVTQIPIYPQTLGLLDYALLTQGNVTMN